MRQFLLVAGIDYEFKGVDFRLFCNSRVKRVTAANKAKDDLRFTIFDVAKGAVVTHEFSYPSGKKTEKISSTKPFQPVTKASFKREMKNGEAHFTFKDGQRDKMSVVDVYRAVQKIGADDPGTLVELSFFSHAWMGGPILVNSFDNGTVSAVVPPATTPSEVAIASGERDPDDNDPRAAKDFISPTMLSTELKAFQKAFHKDGFSWIWGCAFPRSIHEVLHKVEINKAYKPSGLADDVVFTFKNLSATQVDILERGLRGVSGVPFADKKKIELEFKFIKFFFCVATISSYIHHLAKNSGVKAFGGVMGTYSEYDTGALPLMNVYKGFGRHFTFYKNYLGFKFDPEGRRYGLYDPTFTCTRPS